MTIDKAMKLLRDNFERAQKLEYVRDPVAWALYHTWKAADGARNLPRK